MSSSVVWQLGCQSVGELFQLMNFALNFLVGTPAPVARVDLALQEVKRIAQALIANKDSNAMTDFCDLHGVLTCQE